MEAITWNMLLERCPEMRGLRDDAVSISQNESRPWYRDWLAASLIFSEACWDAASRIGVDVHLVRQTALPELLKTYREAKYRLAHPAALTSPSPRGRQRPAKPAPQTAEPAVPAVEFDEPFLAKRGRKSRHHHH